MEKVIRSSVANATMVEFHYILRSLAPAACRDPELFTEVARKCLRVDLATIVKRNEDEEARLLIKTIPSGMPQPAQTSIEGAAAQVVCDLLDALAIKVPEPASPAESQFVALFFLFDSLSCA